MFCDGCKDRLKIPDDVHVISSRLVDRYKIEEVLKSGGMGRVYKAWDIQEERRVAIKEMLLKGEDPEDEKYAQKKFMQEVNFLAELDHKGLPRLIDFFVSRQKKTNRIIYYLVMDYVEGRDLERIIKDHNHKPLPVKDAMDYFRQLLEILAYLHDRNPSVVYRDLKPSNVIINNGQVYLVDFGIARHFEQGKKGTQIGTPGYAAPEQYQGLSEPRSDMYALGVLMHYMLTGKDPEAPENPMFTFTPIRKINPDVPKKVDRMVRQMVELDPKKRPKSAVEVIVRLGLVAGIINTLVNNVMAKDNKGKPKGRTPSRAPGVFHKISVFLFIIAVFMTGWVARELIVTFGKKFQKFDFRSAGSSTQEVRIKFSRNSSKNKPPKDEPLSLAQKAHLYQAARDGNLNKVKRMLKNGFKVDSIQTGRYGRSLLHTAATYNRVNVMNYLIQQGADVNNKDHRHRTALYYAIRGKHLDAVKLLIKHGAKTADIYRNGEGAMHVAARYDDGEIIKYLYGRSDVNSKNYRDETPLHMAARYDRTDAINTLVNLNADIKATNKYGQTALITALKSRKYNALKTLLDNGASLKDTDKYGRAPIHHAARSGDAAALIILIGKGADPNRKDRYGRTPLHYVARRYKDNESLVKYLIEKGADPKAKDKYGDTPLHEAAYRRNKLKTINVLLKHGADVNAKGRYDRTPLHKAIQRDRWEAVELLLKKGADVNLKTKYGRNALDLATRNSATRSLGILLGDKQIDALDDNAKISLVNAAIQKNDNHMLKILLKKGVNLNYQRRRGTPSPLEIAVRRGSMESLETLLKHGANVNLKGSQGRIPLHEAVINKKTKMFYRLLQSGSNVNSRDFNRWTPLHYAAYIGTAEMAKALLRKGANVNARSKYGDTPLHAATYGEHLELVKLLVNNGANPDATGWSNKKPAFWTSDSRIVSVLKSTNSKRR